MTGSLAQAVSVFRLDGDGSAALKVAGVTVLSGETRPSAPGRAGAARSAVPAKRLAAANSAADWEEF